MAQVHEATHVASSEDLRTVAALRAGDESAFLALVTAHGASMLRVARMYVSTQAVAEEVVQETWLGILRGIDRFEGRSSLKTWVFRILTNVAKTRGQREGRSVPFSSLAGPDDDLDVLDLDRFTMEGAWPGHWAFGSQPRSWADRPEERLLAGETMACIETAIENLPETQRTVITLRDVDGWSAEDVCNVLELSETNQRVLLHRARTRVRKALEEYMESTPQ